MESIFQECPNQVTQEETGQGQRPSPRRNIQDGIQGWDAVRGVIEGECRPWGIELHGGAKEEVHGDGQPEGRHYIPRRFGEAFEVCGAKETRRLGEVPWLMYLLQVEAFARGS